MQFQYEDDSFFKKNINLKKRYIFQSNCYFSLFFWDNSVIKIHGVFDFFQWHTVHLMKKKYVFLFHVLLYPDNRLWKTICLEKSAIGTHIVGLSKLGKVCQRWKGFKVIISGNKSKFNWEGVQLMFSTTASQLLFYCS